MSQKKFMEHFYIGTAVLALCAGALCAGTGCEKQKPPAATGAADAPASQKSPPAAAGSQQQMPANESGSKNAAGTVRRPVADADGSFDPATDPVLGWWHCTISEPSPDGEFTSKLWPTEASDARALRTIRFLNDSMATNGCCAGAQWERLDTRLCRVERQIHELYYAPDSAILWFLERAEPENSAQKFKAIADAIAGGVPPEKLAEKGLARAPVKFRR
jgi:hypothetical protein